MVIFIVTIGGVDYTSNVYDWEIIKESIYFPGMFSVWIHDPDNSIKNAIARYDDVQITVGGTLRFRGVAVEIISTSNNSKNIEVFGYDYSYNIHRYPVFRKFVAQTASAIVTSIVNTELSDYGFTTAGIVSTTKTNTVTYNHQSGGKVFTELAEDEDFFWYVDELLDVKFKPRTSTDSGVHLNYANNDIKKEKFEKHSGDIINRVFVSGAPGRPPATKAIGAIYEDEELLDKYDPLPLITLNKPEFITPQACKDFGKAEARRRNQDPEIGYVETELNLSLDIGELVTLTIAHEGYASQLFTIQNVNHRLSTNTTRVDVVYYTRSTSDLVMQILDTGRRAEFQIVDQSLIFTLFKTLIEPITMNAFTTVKRRTIDGAIYGEFDYGSKYYGQASSGFTTDIDNQKIVISNQLLEDFLRIIGQIATIPTDLDAVNAFIATGTGITAIDVTDNGALEGESLREVMEAGYPQRTATGRGEWQILIGDDDAETLTIANVGLFNSSSGANREIAGVLSSSVAKAADEEIEITIRLDLTGNKTTTAGLNLFIDWLTGALSNFLDSGSFIDITMTNPPPTQYDEQVISTPVLFTVAEDQSRYEITITTAEIISNSLDGEAFTEMDLYNGDPSTATKVIDGVVITTTFSDQQDLAAQFELQAIRG